MAGVLSSVGVAHAAKPPRRLGVTVSASTVRVERGSAGGMVVLLGYELRSLYDSPVHRRVYRQQPADDRGIVQFDLHREVERLSVWVAVDVASGAYGSTASSSLGLREAELPDEALKRGKDGRLDSIEAKSAYVYSLLVRPGIGSFELTAGDGAAGDGDGVLNGRIQLPVRELRPIGKDARNRRMTAQSETFRAGDVLVVFLPQQMAYFITEVKR
ncbi:MAG TPA: hypothetical protein VKB93_19725 [Thermoanaerobaculia bacterium]|nr:hypothetical protein [Thermoanaerobaculia bacterium]